MKGKHTQEHQYDIQVEKYLSDGPIKLGMTTSHLWRTDPRHLGFLLSRYKFVAKMLSGKRSALEVGCGDGFGAEVVQQEVPEVHCVDFDPVFIQNAQELRKREGLTFEAADMTKGPIHPQREAAYLLDVLEHIEQKNEQTFILNILDSIQDGGVCIIGTPSLESQKWASKWSKEGHVNCKSGKELKELMNQYFTNTFLFSMNDEVVHTGFYHMAHYLFVIGTDKKKNTL